MNLTRRGIALLVIQVLLVASVAGKYLYERATRPRVWARAAQYDPSLPIRGRYLALSPEVDACGLPQPESGNGLTAFLPQSRVRTFAENGRLVVKDANHVLPRSETQTIWLNERTPCDHAPLSPGVDFFIPDTAQSPFPLKPGEELWVEVTVPPLGPPRPIQLAVNDNGQWKPLKFE
jgi:hypothetical protein